MAADLYPAFVTIKNIRLETYPQQDCTHNTSGPVGSLGGKGGTK